MTDEDTTASASSNERQPLNSAALAQAIDAQRRQLMEIRAIVDSQAKLLHESYGFDDGEADLGYCCDVVRDMLERIIATLGPLSDAHDAGTEPADPMRLAHAVEAPRQQLFRAQAVAQAVENLMRSHEFAEHDSDRRTVMESIVRRMEDSLSALEPLNLGLPIPVRRVRKCVRVDSEQADTGRGRGQLLEAHAIIQVCVHALESQLEGLDEISVIDALQVAGRLIDDVAAAMEEARC